MAALERERGSIRAGAWQCCVCNMMDSDVFGLRQCMVFMLEQPPNPKGAGAGDGYGCSLLGGLSRVQSYHGTPQQQSLWEKPPIEKASLLHELMAKSLLKISGNSGKR